MLRTLAKDLREAKLALREEPLERAFGIAETLYAGRTHWTGLPLVEHVLGVLKVLLPFGPDEDTIIACLLHHVLDQGIITLDTLEEDFGPHVRALVAGIHLLSHVTLRGSRSSVEDLRMMVISVSDDVRAVLIILCDRSFVLDHLTGVRPEERRRIAQDVQNLFAPVAARLGIYTLKQRMERAAFPILYPADAERIAEQLERVHGQYGEFLPVVAETLGSALQSQGIACTVEAREKAPYSIFQKMRAKAMTQVDAMHDLFALRVVVASSEECYRALGIIHRMTHPVPNRFKDFISFPKPNGYQSLHTTVARFPGIPEGIFIEVQVRTEAMHREAELGVAAHWSYKEGGKVLSSQERLAGKGSPAYVDHIFVLTPKGQIVELPEGATPLDFAFQIHTDLGLSFRAAKVNGAIAPLTTVLENGDTVEILRHKHPSPSPEWMALLRMASSRSRLKRYLSGSGREKNVDRLKGIDVSIAPPTKKRVRLQRKDSLLEIEGGLALPLRYAKCCKPQEKPGRSLVGLITRKGDVAVHSERCRMVKSSNPARRIAVRWRG